MHLVGCTLEKYRRRFIRQCQEGWSRSELRRNKVPVWFSLPGCKTASYRKRGSVQMLDSNDVTSKSFLWNNKEHAELGECLPLPSSESFAFQLK